MNEAGATYEVWETKGTGMRFGARFRFLNEALRHIRNHSHEGYFALKLPDGSWFRDGRKGAAIFP